MTQNDEPESVEKQTNLDWLKDGLPNKLKKSGVRAYRAIQNEIIVDDDGIVTYKVWKIIWFTNNFPSFYLESDCSRKCINTTSRLVSTI